jgi:hypothetical protein
MNQKFWLNGHITGGPWTNLDTYPIYPETQVAGKSGIYGSIGLSWNGSPIRIYLEKDTGWLFGRFPVIEFDYYFDIAPPPIPRHR